MVDEVEALVCEPPVLEGRTISLRYAAVAGDEVRHAFTEVVELPAPLDHVARAVREPVLRLLSLAAALSYAKAFAPAPISVPGGLTARERTFLTEVARNGLGEFAYVNDLPAVLDLEVLGPELPEPTSAPGPVAEPQRLLVAVGGGKDSIVSIEALRGAGHEIGLFSVGSYAPIEATAEVAGVQLSTVRRRLDPHLFGLNAAGAPNGHVPVTAVNSLLAVLTALALGHDAVVFSNEASSSFGNVAWHGRTINHQWSKGLDFERLLRESLPAGAPTYVSLLRPLTELRIARRFADHTAYHRVFTSCNRAFKLAEGDRTSWCGDCPKCRFVFLCLAPFLSRAALLDVFGGCDVLADEAQLTGFLELLGVDGLLKPFECVGEPDECRVALALLREHADWRDHPFLAHPEVDAITATPAEREAVFAFREGEHLLPPALEPLARAV
ncbi:hypothetical protein G6553_10440 [Nocardioides sp. IC4_145]|uniref:hypothetical protein n=1 Tax=Nocardioides sp. IC4_145 TaxID=2714037 RepID=UPI001408FA47|nr:hypothetical protein [Nocardioides sp. IC4_145]NHC23586.1 hypothetical protein [Nocardioides sp. IC4_145]